MAFPSILPESYKGSTSLNPQVTSYDLLKDRILRRLGAPAITVEIYCDNVYENISQAIEMFTQYAGYTEEYVLFNSALYKTCRGIKMDDMINETCTLKMQYLNRQTENEHLSAENIKDFPYQDMVAGFDYDLSDYRKVIDVFSVDADGMNSNGINILFTLEQTAITQLYSQYLVGYGYSQQFDIVSWALLKDALDVRRKILAQDIYFRFDNKTQILYLTPEPRATEGYIGVVGVYLERPIRQLISEKWVFDYALALTKQNLGYIRSKFDNTPLFGGGTINTAVAQQGLDEQIKLEEQLIRDYRYNTPARFFIG